MLESWDKWNESYFYEDGTDQYIKSDRHPLSLPNIPLFHSESKVNFTPLGLDSLLPEMVLPINQHSDTPVLQSSFTLIA